MADRSSFTPSHSKDSTSVGPSLWRYLSLSSAMASSVTKLTDTSVLKGLSSRASTNWASSCSGSFSSSSLR